MSELERFIKAQENSYEISLKEIKNGKKSSCGCGTFFPKLLAQE